MASFAVGCALAADAPGRCLRGVEAETMDLNRAGESQLDSGIAEKPEWPFVQRFTGSVIRGAQSRTQSEWGVGSGNRGISVSLKVGLKKRNFSRSVSGEVWWVAIRSRKPQSRKGRLNSEIIR